MVNQASQIWRDYVTDGVSSSGAYDPPKRDIRDLISSLVLASSSTQTGSKAYPTLAELQADTTSSVGTTASVYADTSTSNNTLYRWSGSAWAAIPDFRQSFIYLINDDDGTANDVQATSSVAVSTGAFQSIFTVKFLAANTGAMTLSINGETAKPLISNLTGASLAANTVAAGTSGIIFDDGTSYRLFTDGDAQPDRIAAELARAGAETARTAAEAAAVNAGGMTIVSSMSALRSIDTSQSASAVLRNSGTRNGLFFYRSDLSSKVVRRTLASTAINTTTGVITSAAHALKSGDNLVVSADVNGLLASTRYFVTVIDADTFTLKLTYTDGADGTGSAVLPTGAAATTFSLIPDFLEGVYVIPAGRVLTGAAGGWERYIESDWAEKWFNDQTGDDQPAMQAAVDTAFGEVIKLPVKQYQYGRRVKVTHPTNIVGSGTGAGPGEASISNDNCTQILLNHANPTGFEFTSIFPSTMRDLQINVAPAFRSTATGLDTGIGVIVNPTSTPNAETSVNGANYRFDNVAFSQCATGIQITDASVCTINKCYFDGWKRFGVESLSSGTEAASGIISENYFFGRADATQDSCIFLQNGYVKVHDNWLIGAQTGVKIAIDNFPAGSLYVNNNVLEEQYYYGITLESQGALTSPFDGTLAMVDITQNEFANLFTGSSMQFPIWVKERADGGDWITTVKISENITRMNLVANGAHIKVSAGSQVMIGRNQLSELSSNSPEGISVQNISVAGSLGTQIEVLDNQLKGAYSQKYSFRDQEVLFRNLEPLTYAELTSVHLNGCVDGSQAFCSDGRVVDFGAQNFTLTSGGSGTPTWRRAGQWVALYG